MTMDPSELPPAEEFRSPRPKDAVQSLERGLKIILAFDGSTTLSLAQIVEKTNLSRSATRRLLMTLVNRGYVQSLGKQYQLAPSVLWLGYTIYHRVTMSDICKPHLQLLAKTLGTSASVAVLEGGSIRYICRILDANRFAATITEGTRLPAHQTSLGRVLLAHQDTEAFDEYLRTANFDDTAWLKSFTQELDEIRSRGWGSANFVETGIQSVAVPLYNKNDNVVSAVSVAGFGASSFSQDFIHNSLQAIQETARRISQELRHDTTKI